MKTLLLTAAALVALVAPAAAAESLAPTYPVKVPFLQAAIYVMFGKEGNNVSMLNPNNSGFVAYTAKVVARALVSHVVYLKDPTPGLRGGIIQATSEVVILDGEPCTVYSRLLGPREALNTISPYGDGNGGKRVEFNKMPSPRSFSQEQNGTVRANLPHETWCSHLSQFDNDGPNQYDRRTNKYMSGTSRCRRDVGFTSGDNGYSYRALAALDYIRTNYCMGLPEPAAQPRMPY